jgi:hypothetical protein
MTPTDRRPALPRALGACVALALAGCTALSSTQTTSTGAGATASAAEATPGRAPRNEGITSSLLSGAVLLVDRGDLRLGTTVQFTRVPSGSELHDLAYQPGLARVLLVLDRWPEYDGIQSLNQAPEGVELVAVLAGFPPTRSASEAWGHLRTAPRVVVVVNGPPATRGELDDLNQMRGLDRVIARMREPSRAGFEPLQRPLSFWKVVE